MQPVYICAPFVVFRRRSAGQRSTRAIQVHRCTTGLRPGSFVVLRQRSPASTGVCSPTKEPVTSAAHPKSVTSPAPAFFGLHVAPPFVANQLAHVQCASRSLNSVFLGRRFALRVSTVVRHLPALCIHRLRLHLWPPSTTFTARKPVAPSTVRTVGWQRCLTLRSRREPTAGRATATCYSCFRPACRWRRLTSNVRPLKATLLSALP